MPRTREQQKQARADRYEEYKALCRLYDVPQQHDRWWAHRRELLDRTPEPPRKLTKDELRAFWTDRFTPEEIRQMGGAIDSLLSEDGTARNAKVIAPLKAAA